MTQEEKQLLLQDLCAKLPYGVVCTDNRHGDSRVSLIDINLSSKAISVYYWDFDEYGDIEYCKPYLRPMPSMTEEEAREIAALHDIKDILSVNVTDEYIDYIVDDGFSSTERRTLWYDELISSIECFDWFSAHHFDYRGLIPMNLALEAPEGMYKKGE